MIGASHFQKKMIEKIDFSMSCHRNKFLDYKLNYKWLHHLTTNCLLLDWLQLTTWPHYYTTIDRKTDLYDHTQVGWHYKFDWRASNDDWLQKWLQIDFNLNGIHTNYWLTNNTPKKKKPDWQVIPSCPKWLLDYKKNDHQLTTTWLWL